MDVWNLSDFFSDFLQKNSKISDKKGTFEISATFFSDFLKNLESQRLFQWLFTKKYENQRQIGDFWNLSDIFQWLFEKFGVSLTFFSGFLKNSWRSKKLDSLPTFYVHIWSFYLENTLVLGDTYSKIPVLCLKIHILSGYF